MDGKKEKTAAFWSEYGVDDTATVNRITDLILEEPGNYLKYYVGYLKFRQMREQLALENKSFSVSAFHEAILRTGPSPFSCSRRNRAGSAKIKSIDLFYFNSA